MIRASEGFGFGIALVLLCTTASCLDAQQTYVPLRTQVYGGTYATPAYAETVALAAAKPSPPYTVFSDVMSKHYPKLTAKYGLDPLMTYALSRNPNQLAKGVVGWYAEERFAAHNPEWVKVEAKNHPQYDFYKIVDGKTEYAQLKTHHPANKPGNELFGAYISDLRKDTEAQYVLVPDDHVEGLQKSLESKLNQAVQRGDEKEAAFWADQKKRIGPMGVTYDQLLEEAAVSKNHARKMVIANRIGGALTVVFAFAPFFDDGCRWWNGQLTGSALAYSGVKAGTFVVVGFATSKIIAQSASLNSSPLKAGGIVGSALFLAQEGFLIYEYGGFERAFSQPGFFIETGGNVGATALGVAGTILGSEIGAGIGTLFGPVGTVIGTTVGGIAVGVGASILGYVGGSELTAWLLEKLDPEFFHKLRIERIERAVEYHRNAIRTLQAIPGKSDR